MSAQTPSGSPATTPPTVIAVIDEAIFIDLGLDDVVFVTSDEADSNGY